MNTFRKGNIQMALQSISAAKGRSLLTMLGIIIGVAAVITVICIGEGVKRQVVTQSARYGSDVIVVQPGGGRHATLAATALFSPQGALSGSDIDTVRAVKNITQAVPIATVSGSIRGDHTINDPIVIATSADFPTVTKHQLAHGAFFDAEADTKVVVLGPNLSHKLFSDSVPLGQTVTFRGEQFIVGGILKPFATSPFSLEANYNNAMFMSYSTARTLTGTDPATTQLFVKIAQGTDPTTAVKSVRGALVAKHGGAEDVTVIAASSPEDAMPTDIVRLLTIMTLGIACIAFLVGGIGIMNVMLVSVTERIQEVGLRKAVGATNQQILRQFMTEALVLSTAGALIGVLFALAVIGLLRVYTVLQPVPVWQSFVVASLAGILTGVIFGTFPAVRAARLNPIEALRRR